MLLSLPPFLDGKSSFDPDPGDFIKSYEWTKTQPADNIVPDRLISDPSSPTPTYEVPNYIPAQFTSLTTPPKLLPTLQFQLSVEDNHGLKNVNTDTVSVNVKCNAADQASAQKASDFVNQIISPSSPIKSVGSKAIFPQAINNFAYWLHGEGDTQGLPEGVTGNGVAKPLSVDWLNLQTEFRLAQQSMLTQIRSDINNQLNQMKNGETSKFIPSQTPYHYAITSKQKGYITIIPGKHLPTDFTVAVGAANTYASADLTKGPLLDRVSGTITLMLKDVYDFNTGKTFNIPLVGTITADELHQAIKCLGARNFNQDTTYSKVLTNVPVPLLQEQVINCGVTETDCRIVK